MTTKEMIFVFVMSVGVLWAGAELVTAIKLAPRSCDAVMLPKWERPSINMCLQDSVDTWDCIRHGQYRTDM